MSTPQKSPAPVSNHGQPSNGTKHQEHVEKLAAFIQHHHNKGDGKAIDGRHFIEVKGNDKHVAEHLGISTHDLELSYATLAKEGLVKRHGESRVEILNKARLSDLAKRAR